MSTLKVDTIKSDTTSTVTVSDGLSVTGSSSLTGDVTTAGINLTGELNFTGNGHKYIDVATLNGGHSLSIRHQDGGSYETGLTLDANGASKLFHNGVQTFATLSDGIHIQGPEGGAGLIKLSADEGDDNADNWLFQANTDGTLDIKNLTDGSWDVNIKCTGDGAVDLYHNDSTKLSTTSTGANVAGVAQITKGTSGGATANSDAALILDNSSHTYIQFRTPSDKEQGILFGDVQDNNVGSIAYSHSTNALTFGTNAGERLRLLSGGGITFNGDTAAANALNDYEEGTWTPVLKNGTNTITHTTGNASTRFKYTKIGRLVHLMFCLNNETTGGTTGGNSNFQVTGTPFVPANERIISSQVLWYNTGLRINQTPVFMHLHTSGTLDSYRMVSATGGYTSTNCEVEQVGGSSYMFFQLTYETDS